MYHGGTLKHRSLSAYAIVFLLATSAASDSQSKQSATSSVVDSGSFGILVSGRRAATETFKIEQRSSGNSISSELKYASGEATITQNAEMEFTAGGDLKKYSWKENSATKATLSVEPQSDGYIITRSQDSTMSEPKDTQHPLAASTAILDDNLYSQLQIIVWKYLAISCASSSASNAGCPTAPYKMPVFNPHIRESTLVTLAYKGAMKMKLNGVQGEYHLLEMEAENGKWQIYLNHDKKLVRVLIPSENIEVLRD
jgi:hypothetical protein